MTYCEIVDTVKAYSKIKETNLRERALMDYKLANLIGANIATGFSENATVPTLVEAYKSLFAEESEALEGIKAKNDMEIWKQRMIGFAEHHNRKWGENR